MKTSWVALALLSCVQLFACSSADDGAGPTPACASGDAETAQRLLCGYAAGDLPDKTLGACAPAGKQIPIDHIVLIMQENRSFDHYFQKLPEYGQPDVDVAPDGTTVPAPDGTPIPWKHRTDYCFDDTNHSWAGSHTEYDDGKNDGFAKANASASDPTGARAMGYYDDTDIPFYYQLANTFGTSDRYFCGLLGPTFPNRLYFYAATSFGHTINTPVDGNSIFKEMNDAGVTWRIYRSNQAPEAMIVSVAFQNADKIFDADRFDSDAAAGDLPNVSFVDAVFNTDGAAEGSEHPPADPQVGQHWIYDRIHALTTSPLWKKSALFITFDEHGGLYDHVPPPEACPPDNLPPQLSAGDPPGRFDRYGFRVPVLVVSPYAKAHYVSHEIHSHTSIVRFIQARFNLPALTNRDANSDAMLDFFDFGHPPFMEPPELTEPPVDQAKLEACLQLYPE